jgi:hypothetical protein
LFEESDSCRIRAERIPGDQNFICWPVRGSKVGVIGIDEAARVDTLIMGELYFRKMLFKSSTDNLNIWAARSITSFGKRHSCHQQERNEDQTRQVHYPSPEVHTPWRIARTLQNIASGAIKTVDAVLEK